MRRANPLLVIPDLFRDSAFLRARRRQEARPRNKSGVTMNVNETLEC
jgi:hypothetical protein